ncbi:MAG: endonuclease domain-containing protein [Bacteroidaceae bacterium]|nr:endonuclease domain-containing protein [Bacteroidaceae bacterium]
MGYSYQTADPMTYRLLKEFAAKQRAIPTEAESLFWNFLRASQMGVRYRHQHIIGEYIADFACVTNKLIIEIDGLYHSLPEQKISDEERTEWLERNGWRVIRFTNEEIFSNLENVLERIKDEQEKR